MGSGRVCEKVCVVAGRGERRGGGGRGHSFTHKPEYNARMPEY